MMRWRLALREVWAGRGRSAVSIAGIAVGVIVLTTTIALGLGIREVVLRKVVQTLPIDMIEVLPRSMDLGLIQTTALFGGVLDDATIEALTKLDHISAVYPKFEVKVPMGARGGDRFFGRNLYAELFMIGVPRDLVGLPEFVDGEVIPVVISDQLIEVFNSSVAPALGMPRLTIEALKGFGFDIQIGHSLMLGSRGARSVGTLPARIVGASPYALRLGVTVPIETARRLQQQYGPEGMTPSYKSVLVRAASAAEVPQVRAQIEAMGLSVDEAARRASDVLTALTGLAGTVGVLVLMLAALNIAHSFFALLSERRRELAILRAVGARRRHLLEMILLQACVLGAVGGCVGAVLGRMGCAVLDMLVLRLVPNFPFKPESFFATPLWLYVLAIFAAAVAAAVGALWPALRAAYAPVSRAL